MLKDFAKLDTFLTVVREKSFSKASAKLGISQPAVTQQIKFIEEYLEAKIIERKKNGIKLTKEGEGLYRIVQKMEKCLTNAEKELMKIINKELTFAIGASFTIGNYILPTVINNIKEVIKNDVLIKVELSERVIDEVLEKKLDLALIESPIFKEGLIYREWMEDELVLFSNSPLPRYLKKEDLYNFDWICREEGSHTRVLVSEIFEEIGVDCSQFNVKAEVSSSTAVMQAILKSPKNTPRPTVSIMSRYVVADDVAAGRLYEARIKGNKIKRKFYMAYLKERKHDAFIDNVVSYLLAIKV